MRSGNNRGTKRPLFNMIMSNYAARVMVSTNKRKIGLCWLRRVSLMMGVMTKAAIMMTVTFAIVAQGHNEIKFHSDFIS